jgi:MerR family redox-sensitive transcriptional activator SoxR
MSSGSLLSIGELARRVAARPSALRYWERVGLLEVASRDGGRRRYAPSAVTRVGMIRLWQDAGFHIGEIKVLLDTDPQWEGKWRSAAEAKLDEVRAGLARLRAAEQALEHVLACPHETLVDCPVFTELVAARATGEDVLDRA